MDEELAGLEVYYRTFERPTTAAMARPRTPSASSDQGADYHGDTGTTRRPCQSSVPPEVGDRLQRRLNRDRQPSVEKGPLLP